MDDQFLFEDEKPLPEGWRLAKLSELCSFIRGVSFDKAAVIMSPKEGYLPILRAGNIQDSLNLRDDLIWIPDEFISDYQRLKINDVAVCMSSGSPSVVGKTAQLNEEFGGSVGAFCGIIRPIIPEQAAYIAFWLKSPMYKAWRDSKTRGANIQNLRFSEYESILIPIPSTIEEQRRIAAILDEQMKAVEHARRAVEEQLEVAKRVPHAFRRTVFEGEQTKSWKIKKIGEVAKVQSGYAFKTEWFVKHGVRLLRNANVFQGYIDWDDVKMLGDDARSKFSAYELIEGDIVLSLDRPLVANGLKLSKLTSGDIPSLLLQRVGRFQLKEGVESDFLYDFLCSEVFIKSIKGHDQSLGVPHISPLQVENVEMPIPSPDVQKQLTKKLAEQMKHAKEMKKVLTEKLRSINNLPSALLRKAFAGEL